MFLVVLWLFPFNKSEMQTQFLNLVQSMAELVSAAERAEERSSPVTRTLPLFSVSPFSVPVQSADRSVKHLQTECINCREIDFALLFTDSL